MDISRVLKIVVGVGIMIAGLITDSSWWIWGVVPLMMGIINRCPSFIPGQSSCQVEQNHKNKIIETDKIKQ